MSILHIYLGACNFFRPRSTIVDMTLKVRRKRHEFIRAVSKGIIDDCDSLDWLSINTSCRKFMILLKQRQLNILFSSDTYLV